MATRTPKRIGGCSHSEDVAPNALTAHVIGQYGRSGVNELLADWGGRVGRRACLVAGLCFAVLLLGVSVARADTRTLTFDTLPAGQPVANQYDDGTLGAVQFDYDPDGFHYTDQYAVAVITAAGASSGTQVAALPYQRPLAAPDRGPRAFGVDYGHSTGYMAFRYTHQSVAMNVGSTIAFNGSPTTPITLTAYDANGTQVTSSTVSVALDGQVNHPISVFDGLGRIAYIQIDAQSSSIAIDDVTYDVPTSPPPPDFGFSWPLRSGGGVTLGAGDSRDVSFAINRINGSSGNINLTASNVPAGVTVSFDPNPETAPGRGGVTMHLTASSLAFLAPVVNQPLTVTATPDPSAGTSARTVTVPVTVLTEYDLRARGLEITQGIQSGGPGEGLPQIPLGNRTYRYNGVRLVAFGYKQTVVRFYADASGAPKGGVGADALLYGSDSSGRPLPGSPLSPDVYPTPLTDLGPGTTVTYAERSNDNGSYDFTLPPRWLSGTISLTARISDQQLLFGQTGRECGTPQCAANNTVSLTDIPFTQEAVVNVDPVQIVYDDRTQPGSPHIVPATNPFTPFDTVNKIAPISILPHWWRGTIDITTHKEFHGFKGWVTRSFIADNNISRGDKGGEVLDRIDDWASDYADVNWPVGILGYFNQFDGSSTDLGISHHGPLFSGSTPSAVVNFLRPYTSVAHELGHNLGRQHASGGCGGGANGQTAQNWPDAYGYIRGVGIDFSTPGAGGGPYKIIAGNQGAGNCSTNVPPDCGGASPDQPFDYMSYCANDSDAWISDIGWNAILNGYHLASEHRALVRAHAAKVSGLRVRGFMTSGGAEVTDVTPGQFPPVTPTPGSSFQAQTLGAGGNVLSTSTLQVNFAHVDRSGGAAPVVFFEGVLPKNGVSGIRILDNGTTVAGRDRSAHAPRVRLLSPGRGAVVGRTPLVTVRWKATDADQAPSDQGGLDVALDYSANGGRTFNRIYTGSNIGSVRLPRNYFSRARRARLRITVGDGFNLTTVTSPTFRSLGAPPVLHIVNPVPGLALDQNGTLLLHAEAFDDAGARLTGRSLTWHVGRIVIASGEITSATGLPAGRQAVTLTARDRFGRTASASVRIIFVAVLPAFRTVAAPRTVSRRARSVTLTVSASVITPLSVGGRRFTVGRSASRVRIPIKPGRTPLKLTLKLGSGRLTVTRVITIGRR